RGETRWTLKTKRLVTLGDGERCVLGSITDITPRKDAEAASESARQMLDAVLNASPSPLWVKDEDRRWLLVNDAAERLLGGSRELLIGKTASDVFPPEAAAEIDAQESAALDSQSVQSVEGEMVSLQGERRWGIKRKRAVSLPDGRRVLVVAVSDLTERRAVQIELEKSRQFLDALIAALPQPVYVKDRQHRFVMVNDAFCAIYAARREDLIGLTDLDLLDGSVAQQNYEEDDDVFETGTRMLSEQRYRTLKGRTGLFLKSKVLLRLADKTEYLVGASVEITAIKEAALQIERSRTFLDAIVNAIPGGVHVKDVEGRLVLANDWLCRSLGRPRAQLLGRRSEEFLITGASEVVRQQDEAARMANGDVQFEQRSLVPGCRDIWYLKTKRHVVL